jgi:hypothetical protein
VCQGAPRDIQRDDEGDWYLLDQQEGIDGEVAVDPARIVARSPSSVRLSPPVVATTIVRVPSFQLEEIANSMDDYRRLLSVGPVSRLFPVPNIYCS